MKSRLKNKLNNIYNYINNEEDARVCKDISEDACNYTPVNSFILLISKTLTQLGDALSNPKTVLAWVMTYINAPVAFISFIVPIRESGSMLPQIFIASYVRSKALRKYIWVIGSIVQFIAILGIGVVALQFSGIKAGWLIIGLLSIYSLARGLCSVASKDVLGKTIPKTRRGRLNGYTTSVAGTLILAAGSFILIKSSHGADIQFYSLILFSSALTYLIASLLFIKVKEEPGETSGGGNAFNVAINKLGLLKTEKPFRNFVISRALLLCSALTAPFYVVLAEEHLETDKYLLGLFVIANGLAGVLSGPFWGRLSDISSKKVMMSGGVIAALIGIIMFSIVKWMTNLRNTFWLYPVVIFALSIAHAGVRLGRKTYILDMATGNKRTDYVAVSNTIIGGILLITGGISAIATIISTEGIILVLSIFGIIGVYSTSKLPDVE